MDVKSLNKAYGALLLLSICTVVLADIVPMAGHIFVAVLLILSGLKARVILDVYLGLKTAPTWRRGFMAFLVGFIGLAYILYWIA